MGYAIQPRLSGVSTFILAQTGTGKTLAYVLPIVHKLLTTNTEGGEGGEVGMEG